MAKGLRSSRNKTNNSKLRSKVFGPVESARKERLSAKLLDLATKAKPDPKKYEDTGMDVDERDSEGVEQKGAALSAGFKSDEQNMDIDRTTESSSTAKPTSRSTKRIQKRGRSKAKASMVFPVYQKGRRIGPRLSARHKKQSLKP